MAIWIKTFLRGLGYGDSKMSGSTAQQPAAAAAQGDDAIEAEIQAKASNGPRVTPADIEAEIVSEHYFTAGEGAYAAWQKTDAMEPPDFTPLRYLTFCVLVLRNGFTVTGESACASPENFNAEIGHRIARENAINKVWSLLGFRLRDKISGD